MTKVLDFSKAQDLATPSAFERDPSLVWEFYHYRREVTCGFQSVVNIFFFLKVMLSKSPNPAHLAIAECAERLKAEGRRLRVITQVQEAVNQPDILRPS